MNHAIRPVTPKAAPIGTNKMAGLPIKLPSTSDRAVVGSQVPTETSMDDEGTKAAFCVEVVNWLDLDWSAKEVAGAKASAEKRATPNSRTKANTDCRFKFIISCFCLTL